MNCTNSKKSRGFTLVELMVSVGIFAIVVTVSLGAILGVVAADKKAEMLKSVMNNLNYSLESVSRDLRFGSGYNITNSFAGQCGLSSSQSGTEISFISYEGAPITYRLNFNDPNNKFIEKGQCNIPSSFVRETAPQIKIENLSFNIKRYPPPSDYLKSVFIILRGYAGEKATEKSEFNIQTMVSERF